MLGLLAFALFPTVAIVVLSFSQWDLITAIKGVGLSNYTYELSDPVFWHAVTNTIYYTVVSIPVTLIIALLAALVLNRKMALRTWYRAAFFMPVITPGVAVALVWVWLFDPDYGLINMALAAVGIS